MICFDATPMDTTYKNRGIGRYASSLYSRFLGFQADIKYLRIQPVVTKDEISIYRPRKDVSKYQWILNELFLARELASAKVDVFHATDPSGIAISKKFFTIATAYDLIPLRFEGYISTKRISERRMCFNRMISNYKKSDHIIAISETVRDEFVELLNIPESKISVVPLGFDSILFNDKHASLPGESQYGNPGPFFLYVGGYDPRKNIEWLISTFSLASQTIEENLLLVGAIPKELESRLVALSVSLGISNKVKFLHYVSDDVLLSLYHSATAFVYASLYEGFGLPALEAMACGTPVVTLPGGAVEEVVKESGMVCHSQDEFVSALCHLSADSTARDRYRQLGLARAKQFSWDECAKQTFAIYKRYM